LGLPQLGRAVCKNVSNASKRLPRCIDGSDQTLSGAENICALFELAGMAGLFVSTERIWERAGSISRHYPKPGLDCRIV
ncbi:MAG: hypothetical protein ACREIP_22650, partial [Alphaproteobacteria bacterium]